ncbi:hypothetical protein C8034_v008650 [Colletotrichum sidae]|uniref:Uncharacterized protein n=1 Tax=Colletotrichum sidae TaxID=1347389 RepID=A0A4R8TQ85_9PEZI|nr:hypothetical protein C8034_v008650 [Colletotrichum sidae]
MALDKSDTMAVVPSLSAFTDHPPTTLEPKARSMSKQTSDSVPREPGRPSRFVRQSIPSWLTAFRPSQHANLRDLLHPYPWVYGYTALYTLSTECVRSLAVDEIENPDSNGSSRDTRPSHCRTVRNSLPWLPDFVICCRRSVRLHGQLFASSRTTGVENSSKKWASEWLQ